MSAMLHIVALVVPIVLIVALNVVLWRTRQSMERTAAAANAMADRLDAADARALARAVESSRR